MSFTVILNAIAAIPELIKAIRDLIAYFKQVEIEKFNQNLHEVTQALKQAQTPEEKQKAAEGIQDAISHL